MSGLIAVAGGYALWRPAPARSRPRLGPSAPAPAAGRPSAVQSRLALAAASLEARNYRAAAPTRSEVLALDATTPRRSRFATKRRDIGARFDTAMAEARGVCHRAIVRGRHARLDSGAHDRPCGTERRRARYATERTALAARDDARARGASEQQRRRRATVAGTLASRPACRRTARRSRSPAPLTSPAIPAAAAPTRTTDRRRRRRLRRRAAAEPAPAP